MNYQKVQTYSDFVLIDDNAYGDSVSRGGFIALKSKDPFFIKSLNARFNVDYYRVPGNPSPFANGQGAIPLDIEFSVSPYLLGNTNSFVNPANGLDNVTSSPNMVNPTSLGFSGNANGEQYIIDFGTPYVYYYIYWYVRYLTVLTNTPFSLGDSLTGRLLLTVGYEKD